MRIERETNFRVPCDNCPSADDCCVRMLACGAFVRWVYQDTPETVNHVGWTNKEPTRALYRLLFPDEEDPANE